VKYQCHLVIAGTIRPKIIILSGYNSQGGHHNFGDMIKSVSCVVCGVENTIQYNTMQYFFIMQKVIFIQ